MSIGEVLADSDDGCPPILFDDACASSDPERSQRIGQAQQALLGE